MNAPVKGKESKKESVICAVCEKKSAAYKCPKCRAAYCSKECCQGHKISGCLFNASNQSQPAAENSTKTIENSVMKGKNIFENENGNLDPSIDKDDPRYIVLKEQQKELLKGNEKLKELFKSKRLRDDFEVVDNAPNRQQALRKMRSNPEFNEVIELMLKTVNFEPSR